MVWREERIRSADGVEVAFVVGKFEVMSLAQEHEGSVEKRGELLIMYFQGYVAFPDM